MIVPTYCQVCRMIDAFASNLHATSPPTKNVELGGRDAMKLFPHGITHFIRKGRRIDGGWHIAIARHLQVFAGTTDLLSARTKAKFARLYDLLFHVHTSLRLPVAKAGLSTYQQTINDLLEAMVEVCEPSVKSKCNSIKFHWPRHWSDTRREIGCSAAEKSLERKLGEIQKKNFAYTNSRYNIDVSSCNGRCDDRFDDHHLFVMIFVKNVVMIITLSLQRSLQLTDVASTALYRLKWSVKRRKGGNCKTCSTQLARKE